MSNNETSEIKSWIGEDKVPNINMLVLMDWLCVINTSHESVVENIVFKHCKINLKNVGDPFECIEVLSKYKSEHPCEEIEKGVTNYALVDVYKLIVMGVCTLNRDVLLYRAEIPEDLKEKILELLNDEIDYVTTKNAVNFIAKQRMLIDTCMNKLMSKDNKQELTNDEIIFMAEEIRYQTSKTNPYEIFQGLDLNLNNEDLVNAFVINYNEKINNLNNNVIVHEKGSLNLDETSENEINNKTPSTIPSTSDSEHVSVDNSISSDISDCGSDTCSCGSDSTSESSSD